MGISSAMSPKDRKTIMSGLLEQGAVVAREGKRGTILDLPNGNRFSVPLGTGDYKARLAMRAQIRREGLHWPLDPPVQPKKETSMPDTLERPTTLEHQRVPAAVVKYKRDTNGLPREDTYRQVESLMKEFAENTPFWTDAFSTAAKDRGIPGYRSASTMNNAAQIILDFAGFRVIESKVNRGGYSYRWDRDPATPWPTEFARDTLIPGYKGKRLSEIALEQEARASVALDREGDGQTFSVGTDEVEPIAEQAEVATITEAHETTATMTSDQLVAAADDDAALSLAEEYERRAAKAERDRDGLKVSLDKERRAHEQTRRSLMIRLANQESKTNDANREIDRLRSMVEEERLRRIETQGEPGDTLLARAHRAETKVDALRAELVAERLRTSEAQQERDRMTPRREPIAVSQEGEQWWPLEGGEQSVSQLVSGAEAFGLEVRIQARRRP